MQVYMGGIAPTYSVGWKKNSCMAIFLAGCDYGCPHCNAEFTDFKEEFLTNILDIKKDINSSTQECVFFTGGEPCLQRQALLSLSRHAKTAGMKVGLKTNGGKPETIKSLLNEKAIDFIEVRLQSDFKSENFENATKSKNFFKSTDDIMQSVYETLNLLKKSKVDIAFRTQIVPGINDNEKLLLSLASKIHDFGSLWILSGFDNETPRDKSLAGVEVTNKFLEDIKKQIEEKYPNLQIEVQSNFSTSL